MNLLNETIEALKEFGFSPDDVEWVGSKLEPIRFTWQEFVDIADVEYDNDFGAPQVAEDLIIVGKHWWLERHEYDGSEWWEFKMMPKRPAKTTKIHRIICLKTGWENLKEINKQ